ncbi:MAG: TolC family protein [Holosporales bacterium]|jgi:outer membrane protein|nr:TolC family protein [Holosporales bacterium]
MNLGFKMLLLSAAAVPLLVTGTVAVSDSQTESGQSSGKKAEASSDPSKKGKEKDTSAKSAAGGPAALAKKIAEMTGIGGTSKKAGQAGNALNAFMAKVVESTLKNNKDLRKARAELCAGLGGKEAALGAFVPDVAAFAKTAAEDDASTPKHIPGGHWTDDQTHAGRGTKYKHSVGVSVSQNLFNGFASVAQLNIATNSSKAQFWAYKALEGKKLFEVLKLLLNIVSLKLMIREAEVTVLVSKEMLREDIAKMNVGEVDRTVVAEAESKLAGAEAKLLSLKIQLEADLGTFSLATGLSAADVGTQLPDLIHLLPKTLAEAEAIADRENAQIQGGHYEVLVCKSKISKARAGAAPKLDFEAGISASKAGGTSGSGTDLGTPLSSSATSGSFGLTLKVPIDIKGATANDTGGARQEFIKTRINQIQTRGQVMADLATDFDRLKKEREILEANKRIVDALTVQLRCFLQEFNVGATVHAQVLKAQHDLFRAKVHLSKALQAVCETVLRILASTGRLNAAMVSSPGFKFDPFNNEKDANGELGGPMDEGYEELKAVPVAVTTTQPAAKVEQKAVANTKKKEKKKIKKKDKKKKKEKKNKKKN